MKKGKIEIYIAGDDEDDRQFIKQAINNVLPSAEIIEAVDGLDQLEKLQDCTLDNQFTMMLIDMNMPRLNGLGAISVIKSERKFQKTPIIMISTSEDGELKQQAYALGVDSFITKPFTFDDYEKIAKALKAIFVERLNTENRPVSHL